MSSPTRTLQVTQREFQMIMSNRNELNSNVGKAGKNFLAKRKAADQALSDAALAEADWKRAKQAYEAASPSRQFDIAAVAPPAAWPGRGHPAGGRPGGCTQTQSPTSALGGRAWCCPTGPTGPTGRLAPGRGCARAWAARGCVSHGRPRLRRRRRPRRPRRPRRRLGGLRLGRRRWRQAPRCCPRWLPRRRRQGGQQRRRVLRGRQQPGGPRCRLG
jgi:hypothetical protein